MADSLLSGFRALDLTDEKGFVCGKILAAIGIDVIKIEKPGGDLARSIPPFYQDIPDPEKNINWLAFNTDKKSITLNIQTDQGRDLFRKLVGKADFVVESFLPGYLDSLGLGYEALSHVNPKIIMTSITHFGQKGPHSQYAGSELVDSAMSGALGGMGNPDRPPVKEALDSVYFHANIAAALGTLLSHYYCQNSGNGQQVDVSIQEVTTSRAYNNQLAWQWEKRLLKRSWGGSQRTTLTMIRRGWQCKDGYVFWMFFGGPTGAPANKALSKWIDEEGMENPLNQVKNWEELDAASMTQQTRDAFEGTISKFFLRHTKEEIAEEGLKRGINAAVVNNPADVLKLPHLVARNFWTYLDHPGLGTKLTYPRHFFLCSETENYVRYRAPLIGEHNNDIYGKELGLSRIQIAALKEANVI